MLAFSLCNYPLNTIVRETPVKYIKAPSKGFNFTCPLTNFNDQLLHAEWIYFKLTEFLCVRKNLYRDSMLEGTLSRLREYGGVLDSPR